MDQQVSALRSAGHQVELYAARTDELEAGTLYKLRSAMKVATGVGDGPKFQNFAPHIVHVHNLFPNFGTSWLRSIRTPVVATMHNYRPMCAAGTLFRDGVLCTLCPDNHSSLPGLRHGCYRGKLGTLPLTIRPSFQDDALIMRAKKVVVLTDAMRLRYMSIGVPSDKLKVVPNFVPASLDGGIGPGGGPWLYVGRFSEEKGILPIVRDWPPGRRLIVVGSGKLDSEIRAAASPWVDVRGRVKRSEVVQLLKTATGLIFPSKWLEGLPMVYIEALSAGLPVLTWSPSVVSELVASQGTGLVADGMSLQHALAQAEDTFRGMRSRCREIFEASYEERHVVSKLQEVYAEALCQEVDDRPDR